MRARLGVARVPKLRRNGLRDEGVEMTGEEESEMDWLGFLRVMIIEEKGAREKYQVAVELAKDPEVRAVFERLRDEEQFHVSFLESEYARLEKAMTR